jgi:hypothetical protein
MLIRSCLIERSKTRESNYFRYISNGPPKVNENKTNPPSNSPDDSNKDKNNNDEKEKKLVKIKLAVALLLFYIFTAAVINIVNFNKGIKEEVSITFAVSILKSRN